MSENTVRSNRTSFSANSLTNAVSLLVENQVRGQVHTAEVVRVTAVDAGGPGAAAGYVDVLPLVCRTDGWNNTVRPATLFRLPYSRIQGGVAALVIDPVPGDIGLAVFAKRDSSNVAQGQEEPVPPGSFRVFDQADGFYIGGFLNKAPEIWLELTQDHTATLHAPQEVIVNTTNATINASGKTTVNSPETECTGNLFVRGNVTWAGVGKGDAGPAVFSGGLTNTGGGVSSNGVTLETHTHTGVQSGGGNTGSPNGGT